MSRQCVIAATSYGKELPAFTNQANAEAVLFALRDSTLSALFSECREPLRLDYSPESLTRFERWFFETGRPETGNSDYSIAHAIGFYFGEVLCRTAHFNWVVEEFAFQRGKYEIGVKRSTVSLMLTRGRRPTATGNKRMQSLWREWKKWNASRLTWTNSRPFLSHLHPTDCWLLGRPKNIAISG